MIKKLEALVSANFSPVLSKERVEKVTFEVVVKSCPVLKASCESPIESPATATVTVSVAPAVVVMVGLPAIVMVSPSPKVWGVPESPVSNNVLMPLLVPQPDPAAEKTPLALA